MAKNKMSNLAKKLGSKINESINAHKNDPLKTGFVQLPPGINNGIAKLIECKFDTYKSGENEGEYYFMARGTVLEPKVFHYNGEDIDLEGSQTMVMLPCCQTTNYNKEVVPFDENFAKIMQELRKLGGEDLLEDVSADEIEEVAEAIKEAAPYFKFTTTPKVARQDGNGRKKGEVYGAYENWRGTKGLENYEPEGGESFTDKSDEEKPKAKAKPSKAQEEVEEVEEKPKSKKGKPAKEEVFDDGAEDIDALLEKADDDEEAQQRLIELAVAAGHSEKDAKKADSWEDVAEMIRNPKASGGKGGKAKTSKDSDDDAPMPKLGEEYLYTVETRDPKTKKLKKEQVKCEVTQVFKKTKTVTLMNTEDNEVEYEDVGFDELESVEE